VRLNSNLIQGQIKIGIFSILFLSFLVAIFNTPSQQRKEFNSIPIVNIWNVMHATLLSSVVAPKTPKTKKHPT